LEPISTLTAVEELVAGVPDADPGAAAAGIAADAPADAATAGVDPGAPAGPALRAAAGAGFAAGFDCAPASIE
jgi:hypothetical protein